MANVFDETTSDGEYQFKACDQVRQRGPLGTQREAIQEAKQRGQYSLVTRVQHLNDKCKPDHWRSAS